jgi:hypothetical protein
MAERSLSSSYSRNLAGRRRPSENVCESRCLCGSLLARLVGDQVELKCRRCKRTTLIPLSSANP